MKDNNECNNEEDNNCHQNAICINTNGSFTCQCQNGYTGNGITCNDKWQYNAWLSNSTYIFSLFTIVNSQLKCTLFFIDINECLMEDIQCDSDTVCVNKNENYSCERKRFCGDI